MAAHHPTLAAGRWRTLSLAEQLGNVGSEVHRALNQKGKDEKLFWGAVSRTLELLDLTVQDPRWGKRLKEILRVREVFCDAVSGGREYGSTLEDIDHYFFNFAVLARSVR